MATLVALRRVAKEFDYELWYDRRLNLWTATHALAGTEYWPPFAFAKLTVDQLRITLKSNTEEAAKK